MAKTVWTSVGLDATEIKVRDQAIAAAVEACPSLNKADVLRSALRAGLRMIVDHPEKAETVRAL